MNTNTYKGYDVEDLRKIYDKVSDPEDRRGPIEVFVSGENVMPVVASIEFMTATECKVGLDTRTMKYLVESVGYRAGPAGDH